MQWSFREKADRICLTGGFESQMVSKRLKYEDQGRIARDQGAPEILQKLWSSKKEPERALFTIFDQSSESSQVHFDSHRINM